jgi:hypothetical protein
MWLVITLSTNARQKPWFNTRSVHLERYVFPQPHLVCSFPSQLIRLAKILISYTASYQENKIQKLVGGFNPSEKYESQLG